MMPRRPRGDEPESVPEGPVMAPRRVSPLYRWYHKMWAVLLAAFCLEIGIFLLIFPWTDYWETNYFSQVAPAWHLYWYNGYVRGAVSGIGALNVYIALLEILRLRRFARRRQSGA